nr:phosphatidylcholine:diacylglycerol cholinephosphotransferase 1-like [Ipomoea trifida]
MNGGVPHFRSSSPSSTLANRQPITSSDNQNPVNGVKSKHKNASNGTVSNMKKRSSPVAAMDGGWLGNAHFMTWKAGDLLGVVRHHPLPCVFFASLLFFMGVEYTLRMIPSTSPPFDLGFIATVPLNRILASSPALNTLLAGLNTVFVAMQSAYIVWAFLIEGRPRATISALFMFTCRGILGYVTQLPLPEDFLGSGADFPVGNVSFFLFYSGHVAAAVIASLDMRRMQRQGMALAFDLLNVLQVVRLLSTRGHYTIDLGVGVGAGMLFDSLAGKYLECKKLN